MSNIRHGDVLAFEGPEIREPKRPEPVESLVKEYACHECGIIHEGDICPACGAERKKPPVSNVTEEIIRRDLDRAREALEFYVPKEPGEVTTPDHDKERRYFFLLFMILMSVVSFIILIGGL